MLNKILEFLKSRLVIVVVGVLFVLALLIGSFGLGVAVGYHKARFSYAWGENYHRNFGGPRGGMFFGFGGGDFIDAHGTFGQVIKIEVATKTGEASTLVLKGKDGVEKIVLVSDDTSITRFRDKLKISDIKNDDYVTIIGEPNDKGQIVAKLIRIIPAGSVSPMPMFRR